jgi:hypothetical protein
VTSVTERSGLTFSNPLPIQIGNWKNTFGDPTTIRNYDVSPDGTRFIGVIGVIGSGGGFRRAAAADPRRFQLARGVAAARAGQMIGT